MPFFSNTLECAMLPPETKECGAGGLQCVLGNASVSAFCECVEGWINIGDFALSPSGPCDMNISAVRVLWALTGLANFFNFLFASWFFMRKIEGSGTLKEVRQKMDGASATVLLVGLSGLLYAITAALRAGDPSRFIVGGELIISFIYSLATCFLWVSIVKYASNVVHVAYINVQFKSNEDQMQSTKALESIQRMLPFYYIFLSIIAFLAFVMAIINTSLKGTNLVGKYDQLIAGFSYVGVGIIAIYLGIFVVPRWLDSIIKDCEIVLNLDRNLPSGVVVASKSETLTELLRNTVKKFKVMKSLMLKQSPLNAMFLIICGCECSEIACVFFLIAYLGWPYLTHKSSYILPFLLLSGACLSMFGTWSVSNFVSKDTSESNKPPKGSGLNKNKIQDIGRILPLKTNELQAASPDT